MVSTEMASCLSSLLDAFSTMTLKMECKCPTYLGLCMEEIRDGEGEIDRESERERKRGGERKGRSVNLPKPHMPLPRLNLHSVP